MTSGYSDRSVKVCEMIS